VRHKEPRREWSDTLGAESPQGGKQRGRKQTGRMREWKAIPSIYRTVPVPSMQEEWTEYTMQGDNKRKGSPIRMGINS